MSDRDRDELALAIAHPKRSPAGMVTEPMPDECDRCVDALLAADKLIAAGWRRPTVTPEQAETEARLFAELQGAYGHISKLEHELADWKRAYGSAFNRLAEIETDPGAFGPSAAEDSEQ